jgi:hypothetical protein
MNGELFISLKSGRMYLNKGDELNNLFTFSGPNYLPNSLTEAC